MNLYIEKLLGLLSFISFGDIKKYLGFNNKTTIDIFGNYNNFIESLNNPQSELYTCVWICENSDKDISYEEYKKLGMTIYIIGKIGYIKYIKEFFKFIFNFLRYRKDLNYGTRFYLSIIKCKHNVIRNKFQIEIDRFSKSQLNSMDRIQQLFETKKIDRLYLYKFKKELPK